MAEPKPCRCGLEPAKSPASSKGDKWFVWCEMGCDRTAEYPTVEEAVEEWNAKMG
jgi:hypothetical protein